MMVDSLRKINDSKSFATNFVEHFGKPDFSNSIVFIIDDRATVISPVVDEVNSIMISTFLDNSFYYYVVTREYHPIPALEVAMIDGNKEEARVLFDVFEEQITHNPRVKYKLQYIEGNVEFSNKQFSELWDEKKILSDALPKCATAYIIDEYGLGCCALVCVSGSAGNDIVYEDYNEPSGGETNDNSYDEESGSGSTVTEDPVKIEPPKPNIIINNLDAKSDCVYQKLLESSLGFANDIKKFDGDFPVSHLEFSTSYSLPNNVYL